MNAIVLGQDGLNATDLVRSIGRAGHNVYVILLQDRINYTAHSKYVRKAWFVPSRDLWLETIRSACDWMGGKEKPFLFSSGDKEAKFINCHQEELSKYCYLEKTMNIHQNDLCYQKDYLQRLAYDKGLNIIDTYIIDSANGKLPSHIKYPLLVKASDSTCGAYGGKDIMSISESEEQLRDNLKNITQDDFPVLLQPFLKKDKEVLLHGCSILGGKKIIAPVCFVKTRFSGCGNGDGTFGYSMKVSDDGQISLMCNKIEEIMSTIGYQGLFSAEFLHAQDRYYFLEINFRNDQTSKISTNSGYNLPNILIQSTITQKEPDMTEYSFKKTYYMYNGDYKHVLNGEIGVRKWLKEVLRSNCCWSLADKDDITPFLLYLFLLKSRQLSSRIRHFLEEL